MDRRRFLAGTFGASVLATLDADLFAQLGAPPPAKTWDSGSVRHLLPTVSATSLLIKAW